MTRLPRFPIQEQVFQGETLRVEALAQGVMRLVLDRPQVRNAFNARMIQELSQALATLAHRNIKATTDELEASLRGRVTRHHRFLLKLHLDQIDAFDATVAAIDEEVNANVEPFRVAIEMLRAIPGVGDLSAAVIVSEIGIDMSRFETAGHLISWAGLCPKNDQSAGKRRSTRMKKGAPWLKSTLIQCAWCASRTKDSYLQAQYLRLRSRRGAKKAVCAVAASILTSVPFALMHAEQTGYAIGPFLLLVFVSLVLCWARLSTRSLAASVLVHSSYNLLLFVLMLAASGGFRHLEKM